MNSEAIKKALSGNHQAQAEAISYLEAGKDPSLVFGDLYSKIGKAHRVGITGPPGAGKSTIAQRLRQMANDQEHLVLIPRGTRHGTRPEAVPACNGAMR